MLHGEEFARAAEVWRALERSAGAKQHFIKLDILLQMQRRERSDAAGFVGPIVIRAVARANDVDRRRGVGGIDQRSQRHPECLRDAICDAQSRIRLVALDLAEHGAAHAAGCGELL